MVHIGWVIAAALAGFMHMMNWMKTEMSGWFKSTVKESRKWRWAIGIRVRG